MSSDESMNERIGQIAAADAPAPDPAFVEHLDARLRVLHAERAAGPGQRVRWIPALAAAAVLVFGLVGTIAVRRQGETAVVMTVASDTSVYFDDGPVPGSAGLVLPDGTRIVVGAAGEAVVDGVVLAPGSEAVVVDSRVALVVVGGDQVSDTDQATTTIGSEDERANPPTLPTSARPAPSRSTSTSAASVDERSDGSSVSTTIASDTVADRSSPDDDAGSTSTIPTEQTRPASTTPASTSTTSVARPRPSSTTTTATTVPAGQITLTATAVGDARLRLDWAIERDLAPMGWRIRVRQGDRESTILVIRGADARSATLERAAIVGRSLWVEAVDRSGRTLAASDAMAIR